MKEGQRKRRGFEIVVATILKYEKCLTEGNKQKLMDALERELIIQREGILYLIDSGKASMTSLADIGSPEFGISDLKGRKRKPLEIISDIIRHNHARLSNRNYENLIEGLK